MNQPYESYKPSDIEWLGDIPSHWEVKKLKHIASIFGRIGYRGYTVEDIVSENEGAITISPSNIKNDVFTLDNSTYISYDKYYESPEIMIFPGDIVLVKTGSTIGKTAIIPHGTPEMTINPQLVVLKQIQLDSKYLYYQTVCEHFKLSFTIEQTGSTTPTISQEKINSFPVLFFPLAEQRAIAEYLDRKTAQIDDLVARKEQLLALLQQKRQAIINEAVTRGLDANAPTKDSGIDWLGNIPAHWEVKKLKYLTTKIGSGVTPLGGADVYVDSGVPLLRSQNIYPDGLRLNDVAFVTEEVHASMKGSQVQIGDVLLNITGASIGRCYFYEGQFGEANVNQHVCIIRPNELITTKFLQLILSSELGQYQIDMSQNGASREGLTFTQLRNFDIPTPTTAEQELILDFVVNQLDKIQSVAKQIREQLAYFKTYRQSLISEVVTGKVDVRVKATAGV